MIEFSLQYDSLRGIGTGSSEVSKRVHSFPLLPRQGVKQTSSYFRQRDWVPREAQAQVRFPTG